MNSFTRISILISILCLTQEVCLICNRSDKEITIDSTVLIDRRLIIFSDRFAIEANLSDQSHAVRHEITQFFALKNRYITYPVDIAFIHKSEQNNKESNLILIAKETKWILSIKDFTLLSIGAFDANKIPLDIVNLNFNREYGLYLIDSKDSDGIYISNVVIEGNGYHSIGSEYFLRERVKNGVLEVAFVDVSDQLNQTSDQTNETNEMLNQSKQIHQLNGFNITSGIYVPKNIVNSVFKSDKIVLFANQYFIEVFPKSNEWTEMVVKNITDIICTNKEMPVLRPKTPNLFAWIVLAMLMILVLLIVILLCTFLCVPTCAENCNYTPSDNRKDSENRKELKETNSEKRSALKSGEFSVKSNRDYSQPIPLTPSKPDIMSNSSNSLIAEKPTDLRVSSKNSDPQIRSDLDIPLKSDNDLPSM